MQTLAVTGKQTAAGNPNGCACGCSIPARHARTGRPRLLHLAATAPFTELALHALNALTRRISPPQAARPDHPRNRPASGTGAHPSDLGGNRHTHMPTSRPCGERTAGGELSDHANEVKDPGLQTSSLLGCSYLIALYPGEAH
jgi:hypothetical protein